MPMGRSLPHWFGSTLRTLSGRAADLVQVYTHGWQFRLFSTAQKERAIWLDPQHCWMFTLSPTRRHAMHNTSVVLWNLYCVQNSDRQVSSSQNLRRFRQINNQDIINIITQNLCVNKTSPSTKSQHRQHLGLDKILASKKPQYRQNLGVDKISASSKPWRHQNTGYEKVSLSGTDSDQNRITWGNPQKWCSDSLPLLLGHLGVHAPYATRRKLRYEANQVWMNTTFISQGPQSSGILFSSRNLKG